MCIYSYSNSGHIRNVQSNSSFGRKKETDATVIRKEERKEAEGKRTCPITDYRETQKEI